MKKNLSHLSENYFLLLVLVTLSAAAAAAALFPSVAFAEEQSQFTEVARERQYPGGRDESDLKVQQKVATNSKAKPVDHQESDEGF